MLNEHVSRSVSQWPLNSIQDDQGSLENRVASTPLSEFDQQIIRDHPDLSVAECKIVANMLLKCAEFANRLGDKFLNGFSHSQPNWARGNCVVLFSNCP